MVHVNKATGCEAKAKNCGLKAKAKAKSEAYHNWLERYACHRLSYLGM